MFKIEGKYANATVYASVIDSAAVSQIQAICNAPFALGSNIAIMPDAHAGKGCTIGTTMTIKDRVCPNLVGVDIGCGMLTLNLGRDPIDLKSLDKIVYTVPSSFDVNTEPMDPDFPIQMLACYKELKNVPRLLQSLGSLGGGNHFIELDRASDGTQYLVIHSGSRNLGLQVANYYQKLAIADCHKSSSGIDWIIQNYKAAGREKEIEKAIKTYRHDIEFNAPLKYDFPDMPDIDAMNIGWKVPDELCFLTGDHLEDYLHDMAICQQFARENRELIAKRILDSYGCLIYDGFHTIHNYIDLDHRILRKGSISAQKGERVLIPINMRDGSIIGTGLGNPEWNYSAPHGAGRILSRSAAKDSLSMEEYEKEMTGVYTTSVCRATLDESPMAYKSISDIIEDVKSSIRIDDIMKPIYNFKAST